MSEPPVSTPRERGPWVPTYSTGRFYPLDPQPEDVQPLDLAHHLAQETRFNGACPEPYSVAQHSVLAAALVLARTGNDRCALYALLHDGAEAYGRDLPRPLKHLPALTEYRQRLEQIQDAVYLRFGLDPRAVPSVVDWADECMLATEVRDLFLEWDRLGPAFWNREEWELLTEPTFHPIQSWPWDLARNRWLFWYVALTEDRAVLPFRTSEEPYGAVNRQMLDRVWD